MLEENIDKVLTTTMKEQLILKKNRFLLYIQKLLLSFHLQFNNLKLHKLIKTSKNIN